MNSGCKGSLSQPAVRQPKPAISVVRSLQHVCLAPQGKKGPGADIIIKIKVDVEGLHSCLPLQTGLLLQVSCVESYNSVAAGWNLGMIWTEGSMSF